MKKSIYYAFCAFLFFSLVSTAQTNSTTEVNKPTTTANPAKTEKTLEEKMEGTYMLINKSSKAVQVLTTESLKEIESRRHATLDVYYEVSPYLTIKILPKSVIEAPDFDPKKYQ